MHIVQILKSPAACLFICKKLLRPSRERALQTNYTSKSSIAPSSKQGSDRAAPARPGIGHDHPVVVAERRVEEVAAVDPGADRRDLCWVADSPVEGKIYTQPEYSALQIFRGLVLGCIKTKFCKKICVRPHFSSSTRFAYFCTAAISKFSQKIGLKNQQFS